VNSDIVERLRHGTPSAIYVIALDAADLIQAQQAEIERLRAERDDHKARLGVEAVTAPDADYDTMMDSLQARIRDMWAEIERLRAAGDALAEVVAWWGEGTSTGDAVLAAWEEARRG
jgi:hypothetical protein